MKEKTRTSLKVTLLFLSLFVAFVYTSSSAVAQAPGAFAPTGNMTMPRGGHSATLLLSGKVLIAGGGSASAELYDPSTGIFTATGSMLTARGWHTATLLYDGRVLVAGTDNTPELYDPATGTFAATGAYAGTYAVPIVGTATLLPDGKVLMSGCDCAVPASVTELYDPGAGTFGLTGGVSGPVGWWVNVSHLAHERQGPGCGQQ